MHLFVQAEDGIRYLVRSRGLGDVYKRQGQDNPIEVTLVRDNIRVRSVRARTESEDIGYIRTVSYTHLTLPTSDLV